MHIHRYGIKLVRLSEEHIETVRNWRNAPEIRDFMEFREHITPQMQEAWFQSLNRLADFYFLIETQDEPVGLIHTSGINWKENSGHSGLFIWKKELQGTFVPVLASLTMVDFFFNFCNLNKVFAKVLEKNPVAIQYNLKLGFIPTGNYTSNEFREYLLTKENYETATHQLHCMAKYIGEPEFQISMDADLLQDFKNIDALNLNYAGRHINQFSGE